MKSLIQLAQPLGLVWLLLGVWLLVVVVWRRQWRVAWGPAAAWLLLTLLTCTPLASLLIAGLEGGHPAVQLSALPTADAIVCLGGAAEPSSMEPTGIHLKTAADRLSTALALLAHKKAPLLVLGGGGYLPAQGEMRSEAAEVLKILTSLTGETDAIVSLGICADTHDEAVKVAALARERGWKRILLVTSAYHMPRAVGTFAKAGVPVDAVPCNYVSSINRIGDLHWLHLPHSESFQVFATWFHEVLGMSLYRWRGWM
ncbi:MAG: YdcF family protein [Prosthecobacter sp.]